jgi:hypothetical protein
LFTKEIPATQLIGITDTSIKVRDFLQWKRILAIVPVEIVRDHMTSYAYKPGIDMVTIPEVRIPPDGLVEGLLYEVLYILLRHFMNKSFFAQNELYSSIYRVIIILTQIVAGEDVCLCNVGKHSISPF